MRISDWSSDVCSSELYEDRNCTSRVMPPPELSDGCWRDHPAPRSDDWSGQVRGLHEKLAIEAEDDGLGEDGEGGLQQQRHSGLPEEQSTKPNERATEAATGDDAHSDPVAARRANTTPRYFAPAAPGNEDQALGNLLPSTVRARGCQQQRKKQ